MFQAVDLGAHPSLESMLSPMLEGVRGVDFFSLDGRPYQRADADGFVTLRVAHAGGAFGVVYNDFKSKGGSFGRGNSERVAAYFDEMAALGLPVAFLLDSIGVRLMDGRAVVKPAFNIIPSVFRFRGRCLLVTCNMGRAFGLAAVLYAAGHYRMAIAGKSSARLAGPEVMRMFFGNSPDPGLAGVPGGHQEAGGTLVSDLSTSRHEMLAKALVLIRGQNSRRPRETTAPGFPDLRATAKPEEKLAGILAAISDQATELFPCLSPSVRTYLASLHGRPFGLLVNPPGNPNNLITACTLDRYALALDLFRVMRLPVVSLIDTPGGDPRGDSDVVLRFWQTAQRVVDYPHPRLGICIGRGYGGAIVLGFPKFLGSHAAYVLRGASVGVMDAQFIDALLASSKSLAAQWKTTRATQTADCSDLITDGIIDGILAPHEVVPVIDRFLAG